MWVGRAREHGLSWFRFIKMTFRPGGLRLAAVVRPNRAAEKGIDELRIGIDDEVHCRSPK
jgi:hypothetical protein